MDNCNRDRLIYELADARARRAWAADRMRSAKYLRDKRMAEEDVEFYGNKAAMLQAWLEKSAA